MGNKELDFLVDQQYLSTVKHDLYQNSEVEIRFGVTCPICKLGTFDYDGMLNLVCSKCGYYSGGCFT